MRNTKITRLALIASLDHLVASSGKVEYMWSKYETEILKCISIRGKRDTLKFYKEVYAWLRNHVLELPTQTIAFCKVDSRGIPKPLWPLRSLIKGGRQSQRVALTIARSYELIKLPVCYDVTDIVSTHPKRDVLLLLDTEFADFMEKFSLNRKWYLGSLQQDREIGNVFETLSKGPNGPAVAFAHIDARAVKDDITLFSNIKKFNRILGQEWITKWIENMANGIESSSSYVTGRLGFSAEPGGKTRRFAIADYWSQTSLKTIQISLYRTLKGISTDTTANQDKGFQSLLLESEGSETYCFDLSAASDRIPAVMQKHRLRLMGGNDLAETWYQIMTQRFFHIRNTGENVKWEVGQPLGLLSSFPSFALWHHDIIQFCANRENLRRGKPLRFFKKYRLLGDDVVIFDKKVASMYQSILTNEVGLTINMSKSITGSKEKSQIEFTKRLALSGIEMSSIKRNILNKTDKHSLLDLFNILLERDFISPDTGHYDLSAALKTKDRDLFSFILWSRSDLSASWKRGWDNFQISPDSFLKRVMEKRVSHILAKADKADTAFHMGTQRDLLRKLYASHSVPCNDKALGYQETEEVALTLAKANEYALLQHPLIWAISQTSKKLRIALFELDEFWEPELSPVEYLPIVSSKSFFHNQKTMNNTLSKIYIESFNELENEFKLANLALPDDPLKEDHSGK
jgi:hypothetical protein